MFQCYRMVLQFHGGREKAFICFKWFQKEKYCEVKSLTDPLCSRSEVAHFLKFFFFFFCISLNLLNLCIWTDFSHSLCVFLSSNADHIQLLRAGEHQSTRLLLSNIYSVISYLMSKVTFSWFSPLKLYTNQKQLT